MNSAAPLEWARDSTSASSLQSWSWALAILLALSVCVVILWLRKRGAPAWSKAKAVPVRKLGGTRLNQKVTLEVVEFGGQRILLSVSDAGASEIARESVETDTAGRPS